MTPHSYVKRRGSGCTITIDASPGAHKTEIAGANQWRKALQVRVAAEPEQGKANEELVRFIARILCIHPNSISILRGERSSLKVLAVPLSPEKVEEILRGD